MANFTMQAQLRTETGKNANRRSRAAGRVPAVLYGLKNDPVSLSVDAHDFLMAIHNEAGSSVIDLEADGETTPCVIREILHDPLTSHFLHIDFLRVDMSQKSNFEVDVEGVGTPAGVRAGGLLETITRSLEVRCLPADLPHVIEVDISGLEFGQALHASDAKLPEGVELHADPDTVLFSVLAPRDTEDDETAGEGDEAAEPEVTTAKKTEE